MGVLVSCNQSRLDIPQKGVISEESFYITDEDAQSALVAAYDIAMRAVSCPNTWNIYSQYIATFNMPGDDCWGGGANFGDTDQFASQNEFRTDNQNLAVNAMYQHSYRAIHRANLVINKFEYGQSAIKDRCISEARFLRAFFHMILAIGWDNPPLVTEVLAADAQPFNTPHAEVLAFCEKEFSEIIPYLERRKGQDDKTTVYRANVDAAYAFLAKTQMFEGKYAEAKANLKKVIDSGNFALVPGEQWHDLFHPAGDGCSEKVFEFNLVTNPGNPMSVYDHSMSQHLKMFNWRNDHTRIPSSLYQTGWGAGNPSAKFAKALIANDGMDSYRRKGTLRTYEEVLYEMPWASDGANPTMADKEKDLDRGVFSAAGLHGHEGYFAVKFNAKADEVVNGQYVPVNFNLMRYAEVLLMYAECCAQTNDASGLPYLQMIQERAGSAHISSSLTLQEVKNEKWFEMWFEGQRFIDLVRWGDAAKELADSSKKPGRAKGELPAFVDLLFTGESPVHKGEVRWTNYTESLNPGFQSGKHEHFAYPYSEITTNPNIVQNPGW